MSKALNCESETSCSEDEDDKAKKECSATTVSLRNPTTNPYFGNRMHLHCRTNHFLAIYPDGSVKGIGEKTDYTKLELIATGILGQLVIKGCNSKMLLAMHPNGFIYATSDKQDANATFMQGVRGFYQTYKSKIFDAKAGFLAIKKTGEVKNGKKTAPDQKSVHYLSVRF